MSPLYTRLISAVIGLLLIIANRRWGLDVTGLEPLLVDTVIGVVALVVSETLPKGASVDNPDKEQGDA